MDDTGAVNRLVDPQARRLLSPFVAGLTSRWLDEIPSETFRVLDGTMAFADISGFTRLTEILAARGKVGAEEMTAYLDASFAALLDVAYGHGGELIKWGGDAVLLWFEGDSHAERALVAARQMQRTMARIGRLRTSAGRATLRMSVGVHSGRFHFFLVGSLHRELIVTGPSASWTARMEGIAEAGEIVISAQTSTLVGPAVVREPKADGWLVTASPGGNLTASAPAEPSWNRPDRCLPSALTDFFLAGPIESEHRQVAVAFLEFSGVDDLLASDGAGVVADAVHHLLSTVQEVCHRNGVTFWETDIAEDGGKVMLVAGAPSSGGDDAGALLVSLREIISTDSRLRTRAGVNSGRVFTGGFGPPYRRTYSAKGDAINLAARLMARAGAGEIYASDSVIGRSRVSFDSEMLEPFLVKGKVEPVRAHKVRAPSSQRRNDPSSEGTPLVGREKELRQICDRVEAAVAGRGCCVELVAPAGMGKSRLVHEVQNRATQCRFVMVTCDEYESLTPFRAAGSLVRKVLGIDPSAGAAEAGARLGGAVADLAPDVVPWLPLVAAVAGAEVDDTPEASRLDDRFRADRQAEALAGLLATALPQPTVIVVEDAQWMDDASVPIFRRLARAAPALPWALLVARRTAAGGLQLGGLADVERLELGPLGHEATLHLLRAVTTDQPLVPYLRDTVAQRSGGNPLFLLELVESGRRTGFDDVMPDTVEGVFAAQIDRLSPRDRHLLRVASVLGMQIQIDVLEEIAGEVPDLTRLIDDFLAEDGRNGARFRHGMLRDAAYEGLSYARRRELHAAAGEAIERRASGNTDEVAGRLAVHFEQAGQNRPAWHYARTAGKRAAAVHASVEAATFFARALRAGTAVGDVEAAELLPVAESLGDARTRLGEFAGAEESFRAARRWAADPLDGARLQYKAALATDRAGNYPKTLRMLTLADHNLGDAISPDTARLRAEIRAQYGLVRHRQGRGRDAVRLLRQAVDLAEAADAPDVLANTLVYLDIAELTAGVAGDGSHARRALSIQKAHGDNPWLEARALNQLGIRAYFAGRWSEAVGFYTESRDACLRAGDHWTAAVESANIAEVLADQGYVAEAQPVLEDALETYRAAGTPTFVADGTRLLGRLAARRGDAATSRKLLAVARGIYESDGESLQVVLTDAILAESLLRAGEPAQAAELARRVLINAAALPGRHLVVPLAQRVLGVALRSRGIDPVQARAALQESIGLARRHDARYELALSMQAVSDLWPADLPTNQQAERDALFTELGILESARRVTPLDLPEAGV